MDEERDDPWIPRVAIAEPDAAHGGPRRIANRCTERGELLDLDLTLGEEPTIEQQPLAVLADARELAQPRDPMLRDERAHPLVLCGRQWCPAGDDLDRDQLAERITAFDQRVGPHRAELGIVGV